MLRIAAIAIWTTARTSEFAKTARKKVLAFLHPFYQDRYQATLRGTYSAAVAPDGATLYITWNVSRGSRAWDCCALAVVHIPESERRP